MWGGTVYRFQLQTFECKDRCLNDSSFVFFFFPYIFKSITAMFHFLGRVWSEPSDDTNWMISKWKLMKKSICSHLQWWHGSGFSLMNIEVLGNVDAKRRLPTGKENILILPGARASVGHQSHRPLEHFLPGSTWGSSGKGNKKRLI